MEFNIKSKKKIDRSKLAFVLVFVVPTFLLFVYLCIVPIFTSIYESFFDTNSFGLKRPLDHFYDNYVEIFKDPIFWQSMKNDLIICFFKEVIIIVLTVFFAVVLTKMGFKKKEEGIYRYLFYIPNILSVIVIVLFWQYFFANATNGGFLNGLLKTNIDFMSSYPIPTVITVACWCGIGYYMLILISAINSIPKDIYEAADIDGASKFRQVFTITLPAVRSQILFLVINILTTTFASNMSLILPLNGGNMSNGGNSMVMGLYVYYYAKMATVTRVGYANAAAVILMVVCFAICFAANKILNRKNK